MRCYAVGFYADPEDEGEEFFVALEHYTKREDAEAHADALDQNFSEIDHYVEAISIKEEFSG